MFCNVQTHQNDVPTENQSVIDTDAHGIHDKEVEIKFQGTQWGRSIDKSNNRQPMTQILIWLSFAGNAVTNC